MCITVYRSKVLQLCLSYIILGSSSSTKAFSHEPGSHWPRAHAVEREAVIVVYCQHSDPHHRHNGAHAPLSPQPASTSRQLSQRERSGTKRAREQIKRSPASAQKGLREEGPQRAVAPPERLESIKIAQSTQSSRRRRPAPCALPHCVGLWA